MIKTDLVWLVMGTGATALGAVEALLRKVPKTTLRETKLGLGDPLLLPLPLTATLESFNGKEKGKGKIIGSKFTKNKTIAAKHFKGDRSEVFCSTLDQHPSHDPISAAASAFQGSSSVLTFLKGTLYNSPSRGSVCPGCPSPGPACVCCLRWS